MGWYIGPYVISSLSNLFLFVSRYGCMLTVLSSFLQFFYKKKKSPLFLHIFQTWGSPVCPIKLPCIFLKICLEENELLESIFFSMYMRYRFWSLTVVSSYKNIPDVLHCFFFLLWWQPLVSNSFSFLWTIYITYMASLKKPTLEDVKEEATAQLQWLPNCHLCSRIF